MVIIGVEGEQSAVLMYLLMYSCSIILFKDIVFHGYSLFLLPQNRRVSNKERKDGFFHRNHKFCGGRNKLERVVNFVKTDVYPTATIRNFRVMYLRII